MSLVILEHGPFLDKRFPNPPKLVKPIIDLGGIVFVHGQPECGKTHLMEELALSVAQGTPFLDTFPTVQRPVIMVQMDMPGQAYQERWRELTPNGYDLPIVQVLDPRMMMDIMRPQPELVEVFKQYQPGLMCWDSLRKVHAGDEDRSDVVRNVIGRFKSLFPDCTHFFNHHDRKTSGIFGDNETMSMRGSGAWRGEADTEIFMKRLPNENREFRTQMKFVKVRNMKRQPPDPIKLKMDGARIVPVEMTPEQYVMGYLRQNPKAERSEMAAYLMGAMNGRQIGRTRAYEIIAEVLDG